jgi:hypothetical protein
MPMDGARSTYAARAASHAQERDRQAAISVTLSRWRLATFLPGLSLLIWGAAKGQAIPLTFAAIALLIFAVLVIWHARVEERVAWSASLVAVNEIAIARLDRRWDQLPSGGVPAAVSVDGHPYAVVLDLFGRASAFQWLGPAATARGAETLARWLMAPADPAEIRSRQDAVDQLAAKDVWREELSAFGAASDSGRPIPLDPFLAWAESTEPPFPQLRALQVLVYALAGTLWLLIALHITGVTPALWPIPLLIGLVLSFATAWPIQKAFDAAGAGEVAMRRYAALLTHLVAIRFDAEWLRRVQRTLTDPESAPRAMSRLNRILGFADLRRGAAILHFPIQAFTLWDFHVLFALLRWRRSVGRRVRGWLEASGELDALACLARVRYDNPEWCRPELTTEKVVSAQALAHPLIADDKRVANDVTVGPPGTVLLVTGSNMSGKSTLLRAIGLNVVLGNAGAPVCAEHMRLPLVDLQTSIRVQDSLERGISYFMAALARLKGVVDAAEREATDRVLLYLLDEILQGTNSAERAIAVQAVVRHLLEAGAIGAITTHDLTIAEQEPLKSAAMLVHFTEHVLEDGGMDFDYRLRPGLATSRNALRLMRMIGIR